MLVDLKQLTRLDLDYLIERLDVPQPVLDIVDGHKNRLIELSGVSAPYFGEERPTDFGGVSTAEGYHYDTVTSQLRGRQSQSSADRWTGVASGILVDFLDYERNERIGEETLQKTDSALGTLKASLIDRLGYVDTVRTGEHLVNSPQQYASRAIDVGYIRSNLRAQINDVILEQTRVQIDRGEYGQALRTVAEFIGPIDGRVNLVRGEIYFRDEHYSEAEREFDEANMRGSPFDNERLSTIYRETVNDAMAAVYQKLEKAPVIPEPQSAALEDMVQRATSLRSNGFVDEANKLLNLVAGGNDITGAGDPPPLVGPLSESGADKPYSASNCPGQSPP
jgi:hypothetical protein